MVGLGSLSGEGVLIAGGGVGCTDCFQNDAESLEASLLAIGGINSILNPDTHSAAKALPSHRVLFLWNQPFHPFIKRSCKRQAIIRMVATTMAIRTKCDSVRDLIRTLICKWFDMVDF